MNLREKLPMEGGPAREDNFGDALAAAAHAIIVDGRAAITDSKLSDAEAVHDVRRALKRWRALMRLLAGPVGEQAEQMRLEARALMRALAGARDAQAALDALADLRKADAALPNTTLQTIGARLTEVRASAEATVFTAEMRERLAQYFDFATLTIERWPLNTIAFDAVADGLTATYRRARRLVPEDWAAAEPEHLHSLRQRVVEHRHQMELTTPLWPRLGKVWADEAQRLRNQLGACQDLAEFTALTMPHQPLARWRARLAPAIELRRRSHLKKASKVAGRLFAEKPKAFRNRIGALWSVRKNKKTQVP